MTGCAVDHCDVGIVVNGGYLDTTGLTVTNCLEGVYVSPRGQFRSHGGKYEGNTWAIVNQGILEDEANDFS
jgi:hypothetical protein